MDERLIKFLQKTDWFRNMPPEVIGEMSKKVVLHSLKNGEALINIGDAGDSVFIIRNGWVKISIPDEKEGEIVINHVGPGEFVGELSLIDQKPRSASVIAITETLEAVELHRTDFIELLNEYPMMALYVISNISNRMRYTLTYLDKAIHWSYKIAEGDYSFAAEEITKAQHLSIVDNTRPDETRANRFLLAFFQMVQGVQQREELLIEKVRELTIQFDEDKRDKELESLTGTPFFEKLKSETQKLKKERHNRDKS